CKPVAGAVKTHPGRFDSDTGLYISASQSISGVWHSIATCYEIAASIAMLRMSGSRYPHLCGREVFSILIAVRRWKRDGSVNCMSPEAAIQNLTFNGHPSPVDVLKFALSNG